MEQYSSVISNYIPMSSNVYREIDQDGNFINKVPACQSLYSYLLYSNNIDQEQREEK